MFRLFGIFLLFASLILNGSAQSGVQLTRKLTASEQILVEGSKKAIIQTGISENYFAVHFKLLNVIDKPSDRRVVWQFSIDQYQAVLNDSIGYYTAGTKRIDTHSIEKTLGRTSEIRRTLTRAKALRIMKSCIGSFETPVVQYGPVDGRAELLLVATRSRTESKSEREKEREREREEREKQRAAAAGTDAIKTEGEEGEYAPIVLGTVNLQTGKCTKGAALIAP